MQPDENIRAESQNVNQQQLPQQESTSIFAILGLVFAFLLAPIGLILSIIGIVDSKKPGKTGKGLAVAGAIISALLTVVGIIAAIATIAFLRDAKTIIDETGIDLDNPSSIFTEDFDPSSEEGREAIQDFISSQPQLTDMVQRAELALMGNQLESYFTDNGSYPSTSDQFSAELFSSTDTSTLYSPNNDVWDDGTASDSKKYGYQALPKGCSDNCTQYELSIWLEETQELITKESASQNP